MIADGKFFPSIALIMRNHTFQQLQEARTLQEVPNFSSGISNGIYSVENGTAVVTFGYGPYLPVWQCSPVDSNVVNFDLLSSADLNDAIKAMMTSEKAVIDEATNRSDPYEFLGSSQMNSNVSNTTLVDPVSKMFFPIFDKLPNHQNDRKIVGMLTVTLVWERFFEVALASSSPPLEAVLSNDCGQVYTFQLVGLNSVYKGEGDYHNPKFQKYEYTDTIIDSSNETDLVHLDNTFCTFSLSLYPTQEMQNKYYTRRPVILTIVVVTIILFTAFLLFIYDVMVERRQKAVMKTAIHADNIVASLFPARVLEQLYKGHSVKSERFRSDDKAKLPLNYPAGNRAGLPGTAQESAPKREDDDPEAPDATPEADFKFDKAIAELFPETTVFFADIVGFAPWSSQREPGEVFILLQTVFECFDNIARNLGKTSVSDCVTVDWFLLYFAILTKMIMIGPTTGVFKVETVGESYVAVAGLPGKWH